MAHVSTFSNPVVFLLQTLKFHLIEFRGIVCDFWIEISVGYLPHALDVASALCAFFIEF